MKTMKNIKKIFSRYIKNGIKPENLEGIYKKAHAAIRADPVYKKSEKGKPKDLPKKKVRLNLKQRKDKVKQKKAHRASQEQEE